MTDTDLAAIVERVRNLIPSLGDELRNAVERLQGEYDAFVDWLIAKLKTMKDYYEPPTDGREKVHEVYGWMHVLCFHYEQNRREVKEYDAARREAKRHQGIEADRDAARRVARELYQLCVVSAMPAYRYDKAGGIREANPWLSEDG